LIEGIESGDNPLPHPGSQRRTRLDFVAGIGRPGGRRRFLAGRALASDTAQSLAPLIGLDFSVKTGGAGRLLLVLEIGRVGFVEDEPELLTEGFLLIFFDHRFGAGVGFELGTVPAPPSEALKAECVRHDEELQPHLFDDVGLMDTEGAQGSIAGGIASCQEQERPVFLAVLL